VKTSSRNSNTTNNERLTMQIGMIGLGRMGANMARRLMRGKHECVVYDRSADDRPCERRRHGCFLARRSCRKTHEAASCLDHAPAGAPTEETVVALSKLLTTGDAIIDGGNSFCKDDVRRACAGTRGYSKHPGTRRNEKYRRAGLPLLWSFRRRSFKMKQGL
jgi:hypothetical protein